jgi:hypothetical protein
LSCYTRPCRYTGEDGFEISIPNASAVGFAEQLMANPRVRLAGLGPRDSLRLEVGCGAALRGCGAPARVWVWVCPRVCMGVWVGVEGYLWVLMCAIVRHHQGCSSRTDPRRFGPQGQISGDLTDESPAQHEIRLGF